MTKDEIREQVGGSAQRWRDSKTGRVVSVISFVGMDYQYLRLKGHYGARGSKMLTEQFFKQFDKLENVNAGNRS